MRLPVKEGADLANFDPEFTSFSGTKISPEGTQNFSNGHVDYTVSIEVKGVVTNRVTEAKDNNRVLDGFYADPDILYSQKTGKYYIDPYSDGFYN
ncbi:hypothetical protein [Mangrovibacterium sp.]|uniref:hypothetical protein n=1 Tax=Mangrovibacterium sp. TaxID=1961364 RepID=UPI003564C3BB